MKKKITPESHVNPRLVSKLTRRREVTKQLLCFNKVMQALEGFDTATQRRTLRAVVELLH